MQKKILLNVVDGFKNMILSGFASKKTKILFKNSQFYTFIFLKP